MSPTWRCICGAREGRLFQQPVFCLRVVRLIYTQACRNNYRAPTYFCMLHWISASVRCTLTGASATRSFAEARTVPGWITTKACDLAIASPTRCASPRRPQSHGMLPRPSMHTLWHRAGCFWRQMRHPRLKATPTLEHSWSVGFGWWFCNASLSFKRQVQQLCADNLPFVIDTTSSDDVCHLVLCFVGHKPACDELCARGAG